MVKPQTGPVIGTVDRLGASAARFETMTRALQDLYALFGYSPVEPPILESADPFLDRSGEEIRSQMYIFSDPDGREVCLRPELTIPTARLYVHDGGTGDTEFRAYHMGPVFRFDAPQEGRFRQFTQVGVELFGGREPEHADAEMLALALESLRTCSVVPDAVDVSDVSAFTAVVDDPRIDERTRAHLLAAVADPAGLLSLIDQRTGDDDVVADPDRDATAQRVAMLEELVRSSGQEVLGLRTPTEIAERMAAQAEVRNARTVPTDVAELAHAVGAIDAPVRLATQRLAELADEFGNAALAAVAAKWQRRIELFGAYELDVDAVRMRMGLRRGIEYYSSFVFEIRVDRLADSSQVCSGGRYDRLIGRLSGGVVVPAVGFAIGLERLAAAAPITDETVAPFDVVLGRGGNVSDVDCGRIATSLRRAGLRTEWPAGRSTRTVMGRALHHAARWLVIVGESELAEGDVVVKDLESKAERRVAVVDLVATLRAELDAGAGS